MHENPRELLHVLASTARPVRKGHKPNGGRERSGAVGLCRSTDEPAEQRRATFSGGWGGKGADRGEHRSITHAPDTEREAHVPGVERCAASSKRQESGTVHRSAPPYERGSAAGQLLRIKATGCTGSGWRDVAGV